MQLTHTFTVPVDRATAWATFQDIGSVAECFPGATVTSVEGDTFQGTVKVKLGPIALQYSGSGTFIERDEAAGRMVLDAKGKDKRGNGTAGAKVTATFTAEGSSTRVEVVTDLQVTGKPAQFGRGVMQDVSDKLLGQFVDCLETKVGTDAAASSDVTAAAAAAVGGGTSVEPPLMAEPPLSSEPPISGEPPLVADPPVDQSAGGPASAPPPPTAGGAGRSGTTAAAGGGSPSAARPSDDAIDLGATVLPVLLRSYGKPVALVLFGIVLGWVARRRR